MLNKEMVDMNNNIYGNLFSFYAGAAAGTYLSMYISKIIVAYLPKLSSILSMIGKSSIWILFLHGFIVFVFSKCYYFLFRTDLTWATSPLIVLLCISLPTIFIWLKNTYFKPLFNSRFSKAL
jgi:fucose 4-O-acetylase-like acetyltransferase